MVIKSVQIENFGNIKTYFHTLKSDFETIEDKDVLLVLRWFLNHVESYSEFSERYKKDTQIIVDFSHNGNDFSVRHGYDSEYDSDIYSIKIGNYVAKGFLAEEIQEDFARQYNHEYTFNDGSNQSDKIKGLIDKLKKNIKYETKKTKHQKKRIVTSFPFAKLPIEPSSISGRFSSATVFPRLSAWNK